MATYKIIIQNEAADGSGGGSQVAQEVTGQSATGANANSTKTLTKTISRVWSSTSMLRTGINATAEIINRDSGNQMLQAQYNAISSLVNQGVGIGLAFATGGVVGGAMALAAVGISYAREIEQTTYEKRWESYGLEEQYRRAGVSFNRSRL